MSHVTEPCPFQGQLVIRKLGLAIINPHTKFEVSMFTQTPTTKIWKASQNAEFAVVWEGVRVT